jgi:hypothetical protein
METKDLLAGLLICLIGLAGLLALWDEIRPRELMEVGP